MLSIDWLVTLRPIGTEPCPVPNCALEWKSAIEMLVVAGFVWVVADQGLVAATLGFRGDPAMRHEWSFLIGVPGAVQVAALSVGKQLLQRWAALLSCFACLIFTAILFSGPYFPIIAGLFIVNTGAQAFVFACLKGTRWNSSAKSSLSSPGPGS